jgi:hypothetical protein
MALFRSKTKKGRKVASFSGSMDLRGLFTLVLLSFPPLSGDVSYGINLKYNHEQLLLHFN